MSTNTTATDTSEPNTSVGSIRTRKQKIAVLRNEYRNSQTLHGLGGDVKLHFFVFLLVHFRKVAL